MNERNHPGKRESRRGRSHVLFGDSHLEVPVGKLRLKHDRLRGLAEVGLKCHHSLVLLSQPDKAGPIRTSQVWRSHCIALRDSSISTSAWSYCSLVIAPL